MTPATEALVERLREAAHVQRWANNDPMVCLLVEAEVEIRRLSRNPTIRKSRIVAEPPAGEE